MPPPFTFGRAPAAKPKAPPDAHARVAELAKLLCESGGPAPDPELLKALKREVRRGEAQMRRAHEALLSSLAHRECGPRSHAVAVFDELFRRSAHFRALTLDRLDLFLKRAVGTDPDQHPMPGPAAETNALIARAVRALDGWNAKFGPHLPRLALASRFVADVLGDDAPAAREAAARRDAAETARRENARALERWRRLETDELPTLRRDAGETALAMEECLRALLGGERDGPDADEVDEDEWEDVEFESDRGVHRGVHPDAKSDVPNANIDPIDPHDGFDRDRVEGGFDERCLAASSTIAVAETEANAATLDELAGLCRAAARRLVPALVAALALLARVAPEEGGITPEERANAVNVLAGAKRRLVDALDRCRGVGVDAPETRREEEENNTEEDAAGVRSEAEEAAAAAAAAAARGSNDETTDGGMRITVAGVVSPRDEEDAALVAAAAAREDAALEALLDRARRRREWTRRAAGRGGGGGRRGNVPGAPFWMGRSANDRTRGGAGDDATETGSTGSVRRRARRIFASQVSAHNSEVMRELGEAGVERRDGITGFDERTRRVREAEANEDAARAMAEAEAREAKRRREATTPRQRIEAKLKKMGRSGRT